MVMRISSKHFLFYLLLSSLAMDNMVLAASESVSSLKREPAVFSPPMEEDTTELQRLLSILEKHTEIATKSKLNTDYVPGTVTVLRGEDLQVRGIHTVEEALNLVPGIETLSNQIGQIKVVIRGVGRSYVFGKVKVQINGIGVNSVINGNGYDLQNFPISQVERIDVITGPGSAIHGEYAHTGVINIITRKEGNCIEGMAGSYDTYAASGLTSFHDPQRDFFIHLNFAAKQTDGADIDAGEDRLYNIGFSSISNAPGPANEAAMIQSAILDLGLKDVSVSAYYIDQQWGGHFGIVQSLPPPDDSYVFKTRLMGAEARQLFTVAAHTEVGLSLGYFNLNSYPDTTYAQPPGYAGIFTDGLLVRPHYQESRIDGSADVTWDGSALHTVRLGYQFAWHYLDEIWQDTNYVPSTGAPLPGVQRFKGAENWLDEDVERVRHSVWLQDEYIASPEMDIIVGLRYDEYDDVGADLSPRIAAVWRMTERHILKGQYAKAFRPATFIEQYSRNSPVVLGNKDLSSETVDTFELGYIHHSPQTVVRTTLFYSDLKDVVITENQTYTNAGKTRVSGVELDFEQQLRDRLKLNATLSCIDTDETDKGAVISEVPDWLGNIGLLFEVNQNWMFNLHSRYVGDRSRLPDDPREDLEGHLTVDATVSAFNMGTIGMTVRFGLKNVFDADVRHPSPISNDLQGNPVPAYAEDFPRPGRRWWVSLSYEQ